jgi:hypothetical protein
MAEYPYRPAGTSFAGEGGSSKSCMDFTNDRPGTPPEISKYRKSSQLQPGQRFQHPGLKDDLDKMNLTANIYGIKSDKGNGNAAELINHKKLSELQRMNLAKKESIYKGAAREPLGRTAVLQDPLPEKFTTGSCKVLASNLLKQ